MDFSSLGIFQLLDFVGSVKNFGRFDVNGLPCRRLVVDEASDGAFVARLHGDDQTPIADGDFRFLVDPARSLGVAHNLSDALLNAALLAADALANFQQFGGSVVGDFALIINEAIDLGKDTAFNENVLNQRFELREIDRAFRMAETQNGFQNIQRRFQSEQILHAEAGSLDLDLMESLAQVVEVAHGERHARLQQADELVSLLQTLEDKGFVGRKCHFVHFLQAHLTDAVAGNHLSDADEADFLFKIGRVNHWSFF